LNKGNIEVRKRRRPTRKRGQETFDLILETAASILEESGFDHLNTNIICDRAGLTPPAIYRYFPNKYSILRELGKSMLESHKNNQTSWIESHFSKMPTRDSLYELLVKQYEVVEKQRGGQSILHALRAVPELTKLRTEWGRYVLSDLVAWHETVFPDVDRQRAERICIVSIASTFAVIELLIRNPKLDASDVLNDSAKMIFLIMTDFQ